MPVLLADGRRVPALAYVIDRAHIQYAGALSTAEAAGIVSVSTGKSGPNSEYVFNTLAHLKEMGIEVKADRPGVGANLMDHMEFYFQQVSTKPVSLYSWLPWFWQGVAGAQWMFGKSGLGTSNQFESCAFVRSAPGVRSIPPRP